MDPRTMRPHRGLLLSALGLCVVVALLTLLRPTDEADSSSAAARRVSTKPPPELALVPSRTLDGQREELGASDEPGQEIGAPRHETPAERPSFPLAVLVGESDGRAAADVRVLLESDSGPFPPGLEFEDGRHVRREATTDREGRASFEALPAGPYAVRAESEDGRRARRSFAIARGREEVELELPESAELCDFLVRVVGAGGEPVAGAHVEVVGGVVDVGVVGADGQPALVAMSDEAGVARFEGRELVAAVVVAVAPDGRAGKAQARRLEDFARGVRGGEIGRASCRERVYVLV